MGTKKQDKTVELVDNRKKDEGPTVEDPMVECDFSGLSRRWGKDWSRIDGEWKSWSLIAYEPPRDDLSEDESLKLEMGRAEAHQKLQELFDLRNSLMAQVIERIPQEWRTKDAPEDVDWGDPENLLDYVKEERTQDLVMGVQFARIKAAKN